MTNDLSTLLIPTSPQANAPGTPQHHQPQVPASAQVQPDGSIVTQQHGLVRASSADRQTGTAVFSRILSPSGTVVDATPDTIVDGPGCPSSYRLV